MDNPVLLLLRAEEVFSRTPTGRHIGDKMLLRLRNCLNNPNPKTTDYMSCQNCFFVMEEPYFIAGCPNCGCRDVDEFSHAPMLQKAV